MRCLLLLLAAVNLTTAGAEKPAPLPGPSEGRALKSLAPTLDPIRRKFDLPALGAAVIRSNVLLALDAVGVRKYGSPEKVTPEDKFHIGSCTKSMTATLAAILVEEDKISWKSTIGDIFPELQSRMNPLYRPVTLEQLLTHRGGTPTELTADGLWGRIWRQRGPPPNQRLFLLNGVLTNPPAVTPGTRYLYSNAGYAIAGAMLEKVAGEPWEQLVTRKLFEPLGLASAGFGAPARERSTPQPWGHKFQDQKPEPVPPGRGDDNPAAIAPAGTVHCSLRDLAHYAAFHIAGALGKGTLLKAESFQKLHQPIPGQEYALGWGVVKRGWAGGKALTHAGSNTMFYTVIWMAPEKEFAVVISTNIGGDEAAKACDEAAGQLIKLFL